MEDGRGGAGGEDGERSRSSFNKSQGHSLSGEFTESPRLSHCHQGGRSLAGCSPLVLLSYELLFSVVWWWRRLWIPVSCFLSHLIAFLGRNRILYNTEYYTVIIYNTWWQITEIHEGFIYFTRFLVQNSVLTFEVIDWRGSILSTEVRWVIENREWWSVFILS